ncbi:MAG: hypothetical protein IH606_00710 [Burkholderiales bacterium]|nr:hypothetical protein [Burkholderiales bacterium]
MPTLPSPETVALAHFKPLAGPDKDQSVAVHFNPASLQYTVANTQDPKAKNAAGVQFVSQTTAKLTMDLVFDTTLTGEDVRATTDKMAKLLRPYQDGGGKVPPSVEFGWGTYTFTGIVEQYKETLDFFSAGGVPLRSSVNVTLSSNAVVFDSSKNPNAKVDRNGGAEPVVLPDSAGPASVANALGDPRAARAIASLSGASSLRFGGGASLAVAGSVSLSPPAAFSSGGGLGLSVGGGAGIGLSGAIGIGAGGAGLGVSATAGESFAGLRAGASISAGGGVTNTQTLLPATSVGSVGSAGFALGGSARAGAGGSLKADVGASADLSARIGFSD